MRPVVIVHFQPLELYPPAMNFIRYLEKYYSAYPVEIISTSPAGKSVALFKTAEKKIRIKRFGKIFPQQFFAWRIANYLFFYISSFCRLLIIRPSTIMYYETLSAFPVYLYRKYINKKAAVFIHYHEYVSKEEYAGGMKLTRFFHQQEQFLYRVAIRMSHTNPERIRLFANDTGLNEDGRFSVMPNYPPQLWLRKPRVTGQLPFKIVYVGALSMHTMYTRQFVEWVIAQKGEVIWDIYSNNISPGAAVFFNTLATEFVQLKKGIDYYNLPSMLEQYEAGVILYTGHIPNYVYNAPNKLFEYLACGLDVLVPEKMIGCKPYYTESTYPKVLPVDFEQLFSFNWREVRNRNGCDYRPSSLFYETVYQDIANLLFVLN